MTGTRCYTSWEVVEGSFVGISERKTPEVAHCVSASLSCRLCEGTTRGGVEKGKKMDKTDGGVRDRVLALLSIRRAKKQAART
jgi:hypothetical protein